MTQQGYGSRQYVAVGGKEEAFAFAKALMEEHDCSVNIQLDDVGIYIVSLANRYSGSHEFDDRFVWMDKDRYEEYIQLIGE